MYVTALRTAWGFVKFEQILKFMSEHITALNLVLNEVQPKFSSLLRRVSKILKFTKLLY
ncbi:hypothetical protein [Campylobacter concisus]|nr:hypothetical protein [Campylobacter concisus]